MESLRNIVAARYLVPYSNYFVPIIVDVSFVLVGGVSSGWGAANNSSVGMNL
jgi:hypothetical protein